MRRHYIFLCIELLRPDCTPFLALVPHSRITVVTMTGATIAIDDASAIDTILSVKERVFAANRKMPVRRQRLVYRPGPRGMDALADNETLGGAGVAQDGSAELDVLLADLSAVEQKRICIQVWYYVVVATIVCRLLFWWNFCHMSFMLYFALIVMKPGSC